MFIFVISERFGLWVPAENPKHFLSSQEMEDTWEGTQWKLQTLSPKHMQTRCPRAAAPLPVRKQTKLQIKSSISVWSSFTSCLWFKTRDQEINIPPKHHPAPQAIRISKVNKKWYCWAWIAASIPGRILILAPLYQICHLGKLLFPLLSSTVANNFCLHPSCVLLVLLSFTVNWASTISFTGSLISLTAYTYEETPLPASPLQCSYQMKNCG